MIVIVDYGMGNLGSIVNMLRKVGAKNVMLSSDADTISGAEKIILPGVGAFDNGMSKLESSGLLPVLNAAALSKKIPVLGICLGMQLLTKKSEEGSLPGLGWIDAETRKFSFPEGSPLKIPHMGWNTISVKQPEAMLAKEMNNESRFYFVHSYYVTCNDKNDVMFETTYGVPFVSGVHKDNIYGVQFHPEKSHRFGMQLFKNFIAL